MPGARSARAPAWVTATMTVGVAVAVGAGALVVTTQATADRDVRLHVAIETAAAVIAILTATLMTARLLTTRRVDHAFLLLGLALIAAGNVTFSAWPAATGTGHPHDDWSMTWTALVASAAMAVSGQGSLSRARLPNVVALPLIAAVTAAATVGSALLAEARTQVGTSLDAAADDRIRVFMTEDPWWFGVQVTTALCFLLAARGFASRGGETPFARWLTIAMMFVAMARLAYAVDPTPLQGWVTPADYLRLAFYATLLVGMAREVGGYWREQSRGAVLEERRRIARDLHDGLAQELAFIATATRRSASYSTPMSGAMPIAAAAERALDESRRAIAALTRDAEEPFDVSLAQAVEEVSARVGTRVRLDLASGVVVSSDAREALLRIAREAVSNAGRHGEAATVSVSLRHSDGVHLCIEDDGSGFDPQEPNSRHDSFGLTSMRQRAEMIGAQLTLTSAPGAGTRVEVLLR